MFCTISLAENIESAVKIPDYLKDVEVVGNIVSTSLSNSSNWESALEGKSAESSFSTTSALFQTGSFEKLTGSNKLSGRTMIGIDQSMQVWRGVEPLTASLTLGFVAFRDANKEVELPIQYLYLFQAPLLKKGLAFESINAITDLYSDGKVSDFDVFGEVPFDINLSIYNKRFNAVYEIESISEDEDGLKRDGNGRRITQQVSLSLKSKKAVTRGATLSKSSIIIK
ncbi:hypothetical protein MNB_SUP05-5-913 [hydrothermal vent metagenome]|uniref:Uncharacterized protein n=1 Tax=hydrothermal vent metagenome TaxID=652676 RepID=A0A1W1BRP2_9ZZZZ